MSTDSTGPHAPVSPKRPRSPVEAFRQTGREAGRTRVRVRYAETDRMGVVYYANYLVWFEVGRTAWLRDTGWSYREMELEGFSLPVIEAHCEYRQPARYDDEIEIVTKASLVTPVRIRFHYSVRRAPGCRAHQPAGAHGPPGRLASRVREKLG